MCDSISVFEWPRPYRRLQILDNCGIEFPPLKNYKVPKSLRKVRSDKNKCRIVLLEVLLNFGFFKNLMVINLGVFFMFVSISENSWILRPVGPRFCLCVL
jgi:hypothetical protein